MPGLFRTNSERLVVALLRTPTRRRALTGVAALALSSMAPGPRGTDDAGAVATRPHMMVPVKPPPPRQSPAAATRPIGPAPVPRAFSARDRRIFGWILLIACAAIAAIGELAAARPVLILGAVGVALLMVVLAPELVLALFLLSGAIKEAAWMPSIPLDLTLLSWFLMVLAMISAALRPGGIPRIPRTALIAVGLVALVVASVWWSADSTAGISKAMKFELLTMAGFAAPLLLIRNRGAMTRLMLALTGSGLLIALTTVTTNNAGEPLSVAGGNEITAGLYPAIGLVAALGYLALLPRGWRLTGFLPAIILLPAVIAAGSRGVLVACAVALAYVTIRHIACSKRPLLSAIAVGIALLVMAQLAASLAGGAAAKYERSLLSTNASQVLGERQFLYDRGVRLALDHPLAGIGVGGFATSSIVYENQVYPHNIVLELAAEEGYTAVLLLGLLISAAWWARRRTPAGLRSPEAVVTGGLILLGLFEAFASFDINGNRMLWFALGLAFALPHLRPGTPANPEAGR